MKESEHRGKVWEQSGQVTSPELINKQDSTRKIQTSPLSCNSNQIPSLLSVKLVVCLSLCEEKVSAQWLYQHAHSLWSIFSVFDISHRLISYFTELHLVFRLSSRQDFCCLVSVGKSKMKTSTEKTTKKCSLLHKLNLFTHLCLSLCCINLNSVSATFWIFVSSKENRGEMAVFTRWSFTNLPYKVQQLHVACSHVITMMLKVRGAGYEELVRN